MDNWPNREMPISILEKRGLAVLRQAYLAFRDSGSFNIKVSPKRCFISLTLSHPKNRHRLLTNPEILQLLNATEELKDVLKVTDFVPSMNFSKEAK